MYKNMRPLQKHRLVIAVIIIGVFVLAAGKNSRIEAEVVYGGDTPIQALEQFCVNEFVGEVSKAWGNYGHYSLGQENFETKIRGIDEPSQIDFHPIVIVSTYYITGLQIASDAGTGKVIFERVAYTRGYGYDNLVPREIIPEYKESDEVEYELIRIADRWYVSNPPVMRVSLAAVNRYYFHQATSFLPEDFWIDPEFSNGQRKNIAQQFSDMGIIMQISADYLKRLQARYKDVDGPGYPDKERQKRVKISYNGKWNVKVTPETK